MSSVLTTTDRHRGRVVVVTGGGSGIGLATAIRFAADGASVHIVGRDRDRLEAAAQQVLSDHALTLVPITGDVADLSSMAAVAGAIAESMRGVDVLVNNAGLAAPSAPTSDVQFLENLRSRLLVDVMGTAVATTAFVPHLRRSGSVLNMGSIYASRAESGSASYGAAKGAIAGLTRTLAVELGPRGVRVNCVSPGWVDVDKWEDYFTPETLAHLRTGFARVPLRSAVLASEIASVYSFLAHEDATAITGQDILVDRGMTTDLYVAPTVPGLT